MRLKKGPDIADYVVERIDLTHPDGYKALGTGYKYFMTRKEAREYAYVALEDNCKIAVETINAADAIAAEGGEE